jgi:hypothetical protein
MATYSVQRQFTTWEEVIVEADSIEQAEEIGLDNWYDLQPEGVSDYEPTYEVQVFQVKDGK